MSRRGDPCYARSDVRPAGRCEKPSSASGRRCDGRLSASPCSRHSSGFHRQYAWQILHGHTRLSMAGVLEVERVLDAVIVQQRHIRSFGERLRAARVAAGLTLKEVAALIGYSWVGVERWERDVCRPKPEVLWHLLALYEAEDRALHAAYAHYVSSPIHTLQEHQPHTFPPAETAVAPKTSRCIRPAVLTNLQGTAAACVARFLRAYHTPKSVSATPPNEGGKVVLPARPPRSAA